MQIARKYMVESILFSFANENKNEYNFILI